MVADPRPLQSSTTAVPESDVDGNIATVTVSKPGHYNDPYMQGPTWTTEFASHSSVLGGGDHGVPTDAMGGGRPHPLNAPRINDFSGIVDRNFASRALEQFGPDDRRHVAMGTGSAASAAQR
jgi:hypothetical protein